MRNSEQRNCYIYVRSAVDTRRNTVLPAPCIMAAFEVTADHSFIPVRSYPEEVVSKAQSQELVTRCHVYDDNAQPRCQGCFLCPRPGRFSKAPQELVTSPRKSPVKWNIFHLPPSRRSNICVPCLRSQRKRKAERARADGKN